MGSVVISVDAELGWGFHDAPSPPMTRLDAARDGWRCLLALFDEFRVPATWAVVGHLFLDDCDGTHPDHPTPPGWFERERTTWRDRPDLRFGGDLVTELLSAGVDHDVGSHTFSHVVFDEDGVDGAVARAELRAAKDASEAVGVTPRSFVFPRNVVGHREELAAAGFEAYRGERRVGEPGVGRSIDKVLAGVDPDRPRIVEPYVDEFGVVDVPPSLFLFGFEGTARTVAEAVWDDPVAAQVSLGVERAANERGVFHLWLHPNNVVEPRDVRRMRAVLSCIDRYRRESGLTVETMADVAARVG